MLTGTGRAFCVGQDLKEHVELLENGGSDALFTTVPEHYNPIVTAIATMPKPVIAAVNGVAAGAGASLAFACDFRLLADTAGFNLAFSGIALSCDTGSSWTLPRLVGRAKAIELLYEPRTIPADESLELGLATRVVPADDAGGRGRGRWPPGWPPGRPRRTARSGARWPTPPATRFEESLAFEAEMMTLTGSTEDHRNAVASFVAKEKPTFTRPLTASARGGGRWQRRRGGRRPCRSPA